MIWLMVRTVKAGPKEPVRPDVDMAQDPVLLKMQNNG
jgi:cytochrome d ubiquinol oxidase subunit I